MARTESAVVQSSPHCMTTPLARTESTVVHSTSRPVAIPSARSEPAVAISTPRPAEAMRNLVTRKFHLLCFFALAFSFFIHCVYCLMTVGYSAARG